MKTYTADDFGPNGVAVAALIEKIRAVTPEQATALADAWVGAEGAAWESAWGAAWKVVVWGPAWRSARVAAREAGLPKWDAWYPMRDAALALLVRDRITAEQFSTLYGPWASVMERGEESE